MPQSKGLRPLHRSRVSRIQCCRTLPPWSSSWLMGYTFPGFGSLEVLRHRDCGVFEFNLRIEQRSPVTRSSQVRLPWDRIFLKGQDWRKPPSLKVVIHDRGATLRIGVDKIEAVISDGIVAPISEVQRIRDED